MKEGETKSEVEAKLKLFHEAMRLQGFAGKTRAQGVSAIRAFIEVKGYPMPKKLVKLDLSNDKETRYPSQNEVDLFLEYARCTQKKLVYTMMKDSPCRPRVFPMMRWNWLEPDWWTKDVVHVSLPKELRPSTQGSARKFEPICFLGPRTISLLKQYREAEISHGRVPKETDRILKVNYDGLRATISRDRKNLETLKLTRPSKHDEKGKLTEQPLTIKSWRKYGFNAIDALTDISPEYRKMLKGRDLDTEKYYSQENITNLRNIYRTRIQPALWPDTTTITESEQVKTLREELEIVKFAVKMLQDASGLKIAPQHQT